METMKAFWRYDWALNRTRLITISALAALWPWAVALGVEGQQADAWWAMYVMVSSSLSLFAIPGFLLGYVSELGRSGAPCDFRHFGRSLPINHGRWALAKVVSVLSWGVVAPTLLVVVMGVLVLVVAGRTGRFSAEDSVQSMVFGVRLMSIASAGTLWALLCAALMPRGQSSGAGVFLGAAAFICGEVWLRGVTSIREWELSMKRIRAPWELATEAGLCLLLMAVLALVFVRFHKDRRPWQTAVLALAALVAVDGARALLWR